MPRQNARDIPVGNPATQIKSASVPPSARLYNRPQWTDIPAVPTRTPMFDGDMSAVGKLTRTWILFFESLHGGGASSGGGGVFHRTLDLKDTTVRNDAADDVVVYEPGTAQFVVATLRKTITADLTCRLNLWVAGVSSAVGTFTIPKATPVHSALQFTSLLTTAFPNLSVLTWDVVNSDGSADGGGVASFTVVWQ